jgi:hypothetical protein
VVRDSLLSILDESDVDELRALGEMVGVTVPKEIEEWEPVLEAFTEPARASATSKN